MSARVACIGGTGGSAFYRDGQGDATMKALITCECAGIPLRAQAAYQVLFKEKCPLTWKGTRISILMELVPQGSPIYEHLKALSNKQGKFAYAFEWDVDGNIKNKYNLLNGKEIK